MRKLLLALSATVMTGGMMQAQQIPNADFDGTWVDCHPWTTDSGVDPAIDVLGTEPEGWCISNVMGMFFGTAFLGSTQVGFPEEDGYNGTTAVRLVNSPNPLMSSQIVPGYMTLGTTWSTAEGFSADNKDGGTFGGVDYAYTPDALAMMYKRIHGDAAPTEPATVVAYLWKGVYKQADVPGNIASMATTKVTMVNRDRNILGMETAQGGEVTTEGDACLIAKINHYITGNTEEWTQLVVPFEYESDATPESMNVIIAANDYFGPAESVGKDNAIIVDDVKMVFYSRATALSFAGMQLEGFSPDRYVYEVPVAMPAELPEQLVGVELMSPRATWRMDVDRDNAMAAVTVMNAGEDIDGATYHTYVIKFQKDAPELPETATEYIGSLTIEVPGMDAEMLEGQSVYISEDDANGLTVAIYNFSMGGAPIGDIIINDVTCATADGVTSYTGSVDDLALAGGMIHCSVECTGTADADGHLVMDIQVGWIMDENTVLPITVKFDGWKKGSGVAGIASDNTAVEYYNINGVKMSGGELAPGLYIRLQGNKATKVIIR